VDYGLSVVPQNRREDEDSVGHVSRSSGLLRLEAGMTSVYQFCLKIEAVDGWFDGGSAARWKLD
jgi:hypothetical protein